MIDIYDGNNVMFRAYEKPMFARSLPLTVRQRFASVRPTDIWVWDGYGHNERRQAIYPGYKAKRPPKPEDVYAQIKLWKELLGYSSAAQFEANGWEADDVISTLTRRFSQKGQAIRIHTNDMDYAQLASLPGVTLNGVNTKGVPARWVPLFKAINGDDSDNIDGIPNFGPKSWLKLEPHWPQIERAIVAGNPAGFEGLPFTKGVAAWLTQEDNIKLLQVMLEITHFIDVPEDELEGAIKFGTNDYAKANARMREFFL